MATTRLRSTRVTGLVLLAAAAWIPAAADVIPPLEVRWEAYEPPPGPFGGGRAVSIDAARNVVVTSYWPAADTAVACRTFKYDMGGSLLWATDPAASGRECTAQALDAAGNVYRAGFHNQFQDPVAGFVNKLSPYGLGHWEFPLGVDHRPQAVAPSPDGAVYVGGNVGGLVAGFDAFVVRILSSGLQWSWRYQQPGDASFEDLAVDDQGNVYAAGRTHEPTDPAANGLVVKLAPDGTPSWITETGYGGIADTNAAVVLTGDGRVCVTGWLDDADPATGNILTQCLDSASGTVLFRTFSPGTAFWQSGGIDIEASGQGRVLVTGGNSQIGVGRVVTQALATSGGLLWSRTYPPPAVIESWDAVGVEVDPSGQAVVVAYETGAVGPARVVTVGYDGTGAPQWEEFFTFDSPGSSAALAMAADGDGYPAFTGVAPAERLVTAQFHRSLDIFEYDDLFHRVRLPWIDGPLVPRPQYRNFFDDPTDWTSFHARNGQTYRLSMAARGTALSGLVADLFDPQGEQIATFTEGAGITGLVEHAWTAPEAGSYHVRLSPADAASGPNRDYTFDVSGDMGPSHLWWRTFGGEDLDEAAAVIQTSDGGFVSAGETTSFGEGNGDLLVVRTNDDGAVLWARSLGGSGRDSAVAVTEGWNGNLLVLAETASVTPPQSDLLLVELDGATGSPVRQTAYDGGGDERARAMVRLSDGSLVLAGTASIAGGTGLLLLRVDDMGQLLWTLRAGARTGEDVEPYGIEADDTLLHIAGRVGSDALLLAASTSGSVLWGRRYGVPGAAGTARAVLRGGDGSLTVAGEFPSSPATPAPDVWVMRATAQGVPLWQNFYGGIASDRGLSVAPRAPDGVVVAGETDSFSAAGDLDGWILALDPLGGVVWERTYGDSLEDGLRSAVLAADGGLTIAGRSHVVMAGGPGVEMLMVKTDADGQLAMGCPFIHDTSAAVQAAGLAGSSLAVDVDSEPVGVVPVAFPSTPAGVGAIAQCDEDEPDEVSAPGAAQPLMFTDRTTLAWEPRDDATTYTLYRGDLAGLAAGCPGDVFLQGITVPVAPMVDNPAVGVPFTILVTGSNGLGEGPLGTASDGAPRRHPPCD